MIDYKEDIIHIDNNKSIKEIKVELLLHGVSIDSLFKAYTLRGLLLYIATICYDIKASQTTTTTHVLTPPLDNYTLCVQYFHINNSKKHSLFTKLIGEDTISSGYVDRILLAFINNHVIYDSFKKVLIHINAFHEKYDKYIYGDTHINTNFKEKRR